MSSGGKKDKDGRSRSNSKSSQQGGTGTPARNRDGPAPSSRNDEPRERDNSLNRRTPQRRNPIPSKDETSDGGFPRKSISTPTTPNSPNEAPSRSRGSPTASTSGVSSSDAWTVRVQRNHGGREQPSINAQPNRSLSSSNNSSAGSFHATTPTGPGAGAGPSSNKSASGQGTRGSRGATPSASPVSSSASVARQSERARRGSGASGVSHGSLYDPVPPGGVAVGTHHRDSSYAYRGTISPTTSSVSAKSGRDSGSSSPGSRSRDELICDEPDDDECKYKTELCHTWMENRTCAYGAGCAYAHGLEELRPRPRIETFKSTPCTDPARQNYHKCDYGPRCNYVHPGEAVRRAFGDRKYLDSVYFEALERDFPYNKFPFGIYI